MLDIQLLRSQLDTVAARLATRGVTLDSAGFQALEDERKRLQTRTQDLQAKRNSLSKQIGQLKSKGEDASAVMAEVAAMKEAFTRRRTLVLEGLKTVPGVEVLPPDGAFYVFIDASRHTGPKARHAGSFPSPSSAPGMIPGLAALAREGKEESDVDFGRLAWISACAGTTGGGTGGVP